MVQNSVSLDKRLRGIWANRRTRVCQDLYSPGHTSQSLPMTLCTAMYDKLRSVGKCHRHIWVGKVFGQSWSETIRFPFVGFKKSCVLLFWSHCHAIPST